MNCPKCDNIMETGFIYVSGGAQGGSLGWTEEEPSAFKIKKSDKNKTILKADALHLKKKHWLRNGNYCSDCKTYTFSEN